MICCPGGDLCSLANARSVPVANNIQQRFADMAHQADIGHIRLNISGCMNACGHHHVGHIGVLGVDKSGEEFYQITVGGDWGTDTAIGKVIGPSISQDEVAPAIEKLIAHYQSVKQDNERFIDTLRRVGLGGFKAAMYDKHKEKKGVAHG